MKKQVNTNRMQDSNKQSNKLIWIPEALIVLLVLYCQHIQMTYSASIGIRFCLTMNAGLQLLNMMITALPFLFCACLTGSVSISLRLSNLIITVFSIINYHVFLYHGTPFLASDLYNIGTALNVLSSYKLVFDSMVIRLLLIGAAEVFLLLMYRILMRKNKPTRFRPAAIGMLLLNVAALWCLFFSRWTIFPNNLV